MTYHRGSLAGPFSLSKSLQKDEERRKQLRMQKDLTVAEMSADLYKDQAERRAAELKNIYVGAAIAVPLLWLFLRK